MPNFTMIGQNATVDNGGVLTVSCRAEGQEEIRYELLKDENEAFGFQTLGSVLGCLLCVVLECYKQSIQPRECRWK